MTQALHVMLRIVKDSFGVPIETTPCTAYDIHTGEEVTIHEVMSNGYLRVDRGSFYGIVIDPKTVSVKSTNCLARQAIELLAMEEFVSERQNHIFRSRLSRLGLDLSALPDNPGKHYGV